MITSPGGDVDLAAPAALIGHPARAAMLAALLDGRALPMTVLAGEAGVAPSTASAHLARLVEGGLLRVRTEGRHRYYALASQEVAEAMEALAVLAPSAPVRSLRGGTRAAALRHARTCYDHLAGRLGVAVMTALLARGAVDGGDGLHVTERARSDRLSAPGHDLDYRLTGPGRRLLAELGAELPPTRRPTVAYCVDWSEQQHHLAGRAGAALLTCFEGRGWLERGERNLRRAVRVTAAGRTGLRDALDIDTDALGDDVSSPRERVRS